MMNLRHVAIGLLTSCLSFSSFGQNSDYPVSLGVFGGPVDFVGELDRHTLFDFGGDETYFHFGGEVNLYVNPAFDFRNLSSCRSDWT